MPLYTRSRHRHHVRSAVHIRVRYVVSTTPLPEIGRSAVLDSPPAMEVESEARATPALFDSTFSSKTLDNMCFHFKAANVELECFPKPYFLALALLLDLNIRAAFFVAMRVRIMPDVLRVFDSSSSSNHGVGLL